ncbi:Fumarylacetoacetase [Dactylellina cionopaga]|nr:Fumarylacetoacetase [Dactylellina cionopaga]
MSFIPVPPDCDFTLANVPFGVFSTTKNPTPRPCTAIGAHVLDLSALSSTVLPKVLKSNNEAKICESLKSTTLNAFAALGRDARVAVRNAVLEIVQTGSQYESDVKSALVEMQEVNMHLPMEIGDYTDFYAGKNHAFNIGTLFRGPANALQPNYTHLPVGYHGRASTVVVSGTPIRRPLGQTCPPTNSTPNFDQCNRLDIELEMACYIAVPNDMGSPIDIEEAESHVFGYSLMNDWSARDIQAWEYVPLGPFNAKNFGTSVGGWIVTDEALEGFRTAAMQSDTELLPYLKEERRSGKAVFDVQLDVSVKPNGSEKFSTLFTSNAKNLLFSFPQMIAHHTITGCAMRTGDLLGSGTISGESKNSVGCFLEATQNGKEDIDIGGVKRKWLEDGDEVMIRGYAGSGDKRVGFGECTGAILKANMGRWAKVQGKKKEA